jgi:tRNA pseudouridine32 synthase / 23S rRNA pseudouridine746 synthase
MIPVLFENDDLIAIDKPEGIASIPTRTRGEETVLSRMSGQCGLRLFVVHRLDREVSGVMLFAKSAAAHRHVNDAFFTRAVDKTYTLLAHGEIAAGSGRIDRPIRQFGSGRMGIDEKSGKASVTEYEVLGRCGGFSLVNAYPRTGRRHQIRVHLYSIGHPIAGDRRYGDQAKNQAFPRMMLHASKIVLPLQSGEKLAVVSPLSPSFWQVMANLGWDEKEARDAAAPAGSTSPAVSAGPATSLPAGQ